MGKVGACVLFSLFSLEAAVAAQKKDCKTRKITAKAGRSSSANSTAKK